MSRVRSRSCLLVACCLLKASVLLAQLPMPQAVPEPRTTAASPLEPLAWMAGNWAAEVRMPKSPKASKVLTKFTPQMNGHMMLMETSFDGEPLYQGMFGYDPVSKSPAFWYVTPGGESIKGTVSSRDNDPLFDFKMTLTNGLELHFQTTAHRVDADHYTMSLFTTLDQGATWNKLFDVPFHRVP